jgi:NAD-specific glutamate dehydrogenase
MARFSLRTELNLSQRDLAARVLDNGQGQGKAAVRHWVTAQQNACNRYLQLVNDLRSANTRDFAMLSVAVSEARRLADTTAA